MFVGAAVAGTFVDGGLVGGTDVLVNGGVSVGAGVNVLVGLGVALATLNEKHYSALGALKTLRPYSR